MISHGISTGAPVFSTTTVFGLAAVLGPTAGGYLTDNLGWRWVFYVNVPVGILAVLVVASTMPICPNPGVLA